jgi:hypothetical protein
MLTKRRIILSSLSYLGIPTTSVAARPEIIEAIRAALDDMVASWVTDGVSIPWSDTQDLDEELPTGGTYALALSGNLAILASAIMGVPMPDQIASLAIGSLQSIKTKIVMRVPLQRLPFGTMTGGDTGMVRTDNGAYDEDK